MSKRKIKSLALYSVVLTLSIIFVLSSVLILILFVIKNDFRQNDNITNISLIQVDEFNKNTVNLDSSIKLNNKLFETKQVVASISASQDTYLRVFVDFDFSFKDTNASKRYDANLEQNLRQIMENFPFVIEQYCFTNFDDGYLYLTNKNGQPITLSQLANFYDVTKEKYIFSILNFSNFVLNNSFSIFQSDTYQYYNYNLKIELQTLKINAQQNNPTLANLSISYKEKYIHFEDKINLRYDNILGYYLNLGSYPYNFETVSLRGRKIKWLALNYSLDSEQPVTLYSEFILETKTYSANYIRTSNNIYFNTETGAYANDYYGSDVRAYLTSEEFLNKYNISVEDATYKAILNQNILNIFNSSVDFLNGDYIANSNIEFLNQYNPEFSLQSDKFTLLSYNDISLYNYASQGKYSYYDDQIPINYNNVNYNYDNFIFELANFLKNNLDLFLQDEVNCAMYDYFFNQPIDGYQSRYEQSKEIMVYNDLYAVTDEQFIRIYYFLYGNICIYEEGNPAYGADDLTLYLLKWNSSYALISKIQAFLKQFSDSNISILMSSNYDFVDNWGIEKVGMFFNWETNSPVSTTSSLVYGVSDFGELGHMGTMDEANGLRPSFKISL